MRSAITALLTMVAVALPFSGCADGRGVTAPRQAATMANDDRGLGPTFTSFDPPGSTLTLPTDINTPGQIVGRYLSAGKTHGFLREPDGTITTIDYPGAGFTVAGSINNSGSIVGWYTLLASPTFES